MHEHKVTHQSERRALKILKQHFTKVEKSPYRCFFDFLAKKGKVNFIIEVKYVAIPYRSGNIVFKWAQFYKLIRSKNFILFVTTNKGNTFISPKQIFRFAHLHYNELNPEEKNIVLRVTSHKGHLFPTQLEQCQLCHGPITKRLFKN